MARKLEANLLGGVQFVVDDKKIVNPPARVGQALLVYLLHQARPVSREQLMDWFFRENDPQQARTNLRATLSRIKKHIGDVLAANRAEVWLRDDVEIRIDSAEFSQQLATLRQTTEQPSLTPHSTISNLQSVLSTYHGDFLAGFFLRDAPDFEQWMVVERERQRLLAIDGLQELIRKQVNAADFSAALQSTNRLVAIEPLLEQAQRNRLLLMARSGQRASALREAQTLRKLFADELGVSLSVSTEQIVARIEAMADVPSLVVPQHRRPLVGRMDEIARLQQAIAVSGMRLVTVVGPGGTGKTRLAQAAAQQLYEQAPGLFLDGIFFVPLVMATSTEMLATQLAQTLGIKLTGSTLPSAQLLAKLAKREMLLVLDNFEQLVDSASDFVAELLEGCPSIRFLITSRERLHLYEENVFRLGGLPFEGAESSSDSSLTTDAEQLLLSNLRQHDLGYSPDADDAVQIGRLCALLEGVPLALELAAGSAESRTLAQLYADIAANLDVLQTSMRNVPERQYNLRAVFMHSWRLLSAELQRTLSALAVFPTTFAVADAESIVGASRTSLNSLIEKSLLQALDEDRLSLHPLLRQYTLELLNEDADRADTQFAAHSHHYAAWAFSIQWALVGANCNAKIAQIKTELDNLRGAWRTAVAQLASPIISQLRDTFHRFYDSQGMYVEAQEQYELARGAYEREFGSAEKMSHEQLQAYTGVVMRSGWYQFRRGQIVRARSMLEQAVALYRQLDDGKQLAVALTDLASVARYMGDRPYTKQLQAEALALHQRFGNTFAAVITMTTMGYVARDEGRYDDAWQLGTDALEIADESTYWQSSMNLYKMLASVAMHMSETADAQRFNQMALTIARDNHFLSGQIESHYQIANTALRSNNLDMALEHTELCCALLEQLNEPIRNVYALLLYFNVLSARNENKPALEKLRGASAALAQRPHTTLRLSLLMSIAEVALAAGEDDATPWLHALLADENAPAGMRKAAEALLGESDLAAASINSAEALDAARRWLNSQA